MTAMSLRLRQALVLAQTANALRPLRSVGAGVPAFVGGWMTSELAPQLLAATVLDATVEVTYRRRRPGHPDRVGLGLAAASAVGLGLMVRESLRSARRIESTLDDGLGADYLDVLEEPPGAADLRLHLRELARPFRLTDPEVEVVRDVSYVTGVDARRARSTSTGPPVSTSTVRPCWCRCTAARGRWAARRPRACC